MKFRWNIAPAQPLLAEKLAKDLSLTPLLAQCLINRGFSDPEAITHFLDPKLKHLADPFLLPNMAAAIDRLLRARENGELVVIFGDYDVDGVTSTSLLREVLVKLGWLVEHYLPHRMDEGYGLSRDGVENCVRKYPVKLMLAVDCGSTAVESIAWLRERGVDTLVLDHHQVSDPPPVAVAIVNPQLTKIGDSKGEFTELCSVGLAFKLAHALLKRGREIEMPGAAEFDLRPLLDLVALGTIADIVPLIGENRIFVSTGLDRLNHTTRPGLIALKEVAQSPAVLTSYDVGFQLAPRLNAAGRMETAEEALFLLLSPDAEEAMPIAQTLDARNRERQGIERGMAEEAVGAVKARFKPETDFVIVEGQLLWHIGVVGIVASRVLQQFYRPSIIFGGDAENWRGSGRSIAGFDLAAALRECDDLLIRHGGHAMAAGLTIHPSKVDEFRARLNKIAQRMIKREDLVPPVRIDAEIKLEEISMARMDQLNRLRPIGQANPAVQFVARNLTHAKPLQRVGKNLQHVKMWVTDSTATHECVWWNAGGESLPVGKFDLAFAPTISEFNGRSTVQFKVLDWRAAE